MNLVTRNRAKYINEPIFVYVKEFKLSRNLKWNPMDSSDLFLYLFSIYGCHCMFLLISWMANNKFFSNAALCVSHSLFIAFLLRCKRLQCVGPSYHRGIGVTNLFTVKGSFQHNRLMNTGVILTSLADWFSVVCDRKENREKKRSTDQAKEDPLIVYTNK